MNHALRHRPEMFGCKHWGGDEAFESFDKADNGRQIFRSGPALVFMAPAKEYWVGHQGRFHKQCPGAFWPMKLVAANGNQVGIKLSDGIEGLFAEALDCIGMKFNASLVAQGSEFRNGLDCANLIVGGHDRDKNRV